MKVKEEDRCYEGHLVMDKFGGVSINNELLERQFVLIK